MKKNLKIISQVISKIVIIFLMITLIYILYSKYIAKDKITKIGGYGFLVVISGSMEPEIETNELVIIKECDTYSEGNIVTYDFNDYLVTHRIIKIEGTDVITKGDSNNATDEAIDISQIEGKVVYHSKALGIFVVYYLKIFLILFIFIVLIRNGGGKSEKRKVSKRRTKEEKQKAKSKK